MNILTSGSHFNQMKKNEPPFSSFSLLKNQTSNKSQSSSSLNVKIAEQFKENFSSSSSSSYSCDSSKQKIPEKCQKADSKMVPFIKSTIYLIPSLSLKKITFPPLEKIFNDVVNKNLPEKIATILNSKKPCTFEVLCGSPQAFLNHYEKKNKEMNFSDWGKLGYCNEKNNRLKNAIICYQNGYKMGDPIAISHLARCAKIGLGVSLDLELSDSLYKQAAQKGNTEALRILAIEHGKKLFLKDQQISAEYFADAALLGDTIAMVNLGNYYIHGFGVNKNHEIGIRLYFQAANQGNSLATKFIASCFSSLSKEKANFYLKRAQELRVWELLSYHM